jgi:Uma2 family endonuclease
MSALLEAPQQKWRPLQKQTIRNTTLSRPRPYRFTREQVYRLCDEGWFAHERIMLIPGKVIVIPPPSPEHDFTLESLAEILRSMIPAEHDIRTDKGFNIGKYNEPLSDLIVVPGSRHTYMRAHPTAAVFAAEVSNTTLKLDTTTKVSLYARAGVPEYWVVDLAGRRIIVHTQPQSDDGVHSYGSVVSYGDGQGVAPHFAPDRPIQVEALLPPVAA